MSRDTALKVSIEAAGTKVSQSAGDEPLPLLYVDLDVEVVSANAITCKTLQLSDGVTADLIILNFSYVQHDTDLDEPRYPD